MLKLHLLCWGVLNLLIYCIEFRNRWNEKKPKNPVHPHPSLSHNETIPNIKEIIWLTIVPNKYLEYVEIIFHSLNFSTFSADLLIKVCTVVQCKVFPPFLIS